MYKSHLRKMRVELNNPVDYWLPVEDGEVYINDLIGKEIQLSFPFLRCTTLSNLAA